TGAGGFLGSALVRSLLAKDASVVVLTRRPLSEAAFTSDGLTSQLAKMVVGSVTDFETVNQLVKTQKIEVIYHLADLPLVEIGQSNPIKTFEVNIGGTWNVLEAARQNQ